MPSSGTKATGTVKAALGPFRCDNCKKWSDGVCYDPEIAADPENKADLMADGHVKKMAGDCSNEFLSLLDPREPGFKVPLRSDTTLGGKFVMLAKKGGKK